jgi:hypothetical protein
MIHETRYDRLVNKLYGELALSPKEAGRILDKVEALATERTKALAKIREQAHRDYCRADHTFNKHWQEAWVAARDEVMEKHDNS